VLHLMKKVYIIMALSPYSFIMFNFFLDKGKKHPASMHQCHGRDLFNFWKSCLICVHMHVFGEALICIFFAW